MFTIRDVGHLSQEIKKSRFTAICGPVGSEAEAKAFIAGHSDPGATHNCWAWRIGSVYRFNDDGEPGGTAGKPILQAIDGQELDQVAVLVIRWFGGILLGSGGLIRAYGGTAASCLRQVEKVERIVMVQAVIVADFSDLQLIRARIAAHGAVVRDEAFTATGAELCVDIPEAGVEAVGALVRDISRGRARFKRKDPT
ncbi:IMPACT family protein [Ensifer soli]|uniref:IMPACT family protein n=1 Tax=Ciceribacter sp. sgz301302 TaxID=3342379 RepID=UPI0035BA13FD